MATVGANPNADPALALRYALWAARDKFAAKKSAAKRAYRRVVVFTCREDPSGGDKRKRCAVSLSLSLSLSLPRGGGGCGWDGGWG